jgi:hypothetical protein
MRIKVRNAPILLKKKITKMLAFVLKRVFVACEVVTMGFQDSAFRLVR